MVTTTTTNLTPSVWISSFGAYNAGYLIGAWYDATEAADVTAKDLFEGSPYRWTDDEELWCFDIENLPISREMSPHEATQWGEALEAVDEHLRPALHAWVRSGSYTAEGNTDLPSIGEFTDRYRGQFDSFEDYLRDLADDTGIFHNVPDEIKRYFDWARYTSDEQHSYNVVEAAKSADGVYVFIA
ncbi:antirestriction protein ArdA [Leucobacter sp. HY1910]